QIAAGSIVIPDVILGINMVAGSLNQSSTHQKGIPAGVEQLETGILRARGEVYLALVRHEGVLHRGPSQVRLMIHWLQRGGTPGHHAQNQPQAQWREKPSRELTGHGVVSCLA